MSDFKAKMHQIRFVQGLPQTPLGELAVLPIPLAVFKVPTSRGGEGRGGEVCPHLGSLDPPLGKATGEKGKERSLGWSIQALLSKYR